MAAMRVQEPSGVRCPALRLGLAGRFDRLRERRAARRSRREFDAVLRAWMRGGPLPKQSRAGS